MIEAESAVDAALQGLAAVDAALRLLVGITRKLEIVELWLFGALEKFCFPGLVR